MVRLVACGSSQQSTLASIGAGLEDRRREKWYGDPKLTPRSASKLELVTKVTGREGSKAFVWAISVLSTERRRQAVREGSKVPLSPSPSHLPEAKNCCSPPYLNYVLGKQTCSSSFRSCSQT